MFYGFYPKAENKTLPKEKIENPKIAVIMPVYVGSQARTHYTSLNEDLTVSKGWEENKLESIKFSLSCYERFHTGLNYEIILIDNGTQNQEAIEFYKATKLQMKRRPNKGFSFGAWKYAWENFKDFDYYLFTEADYAPCKDFWLEEILDEFLAEGVGAVGNVLESRGIGKCEDAPTPIITKKPKEPIKYYLEKAGREKWMYNFDGCYTFTSKKILEQMDKNGGLLVYGCTGGKTVAQQQMASTNEVCFQQPILNLGYKIAAFGHPNFWESDRIYFYGMRSGDLTREFNTKKLAPIVNGNTRNTCKQMKNYFFT